MGDLNIKIPNYSSALQFFILSGPFFRLGSSGLLCCGCCSERSWGRRSGLGMHTTIMAIIAGACRVHLPPNKSNVHSMALLCDPWKEARPPSRPSPFPGYLAGVHLRLWWSLPPEAPAQKLRLPSHASVLCGVENANKSHLNFMVDTLARRLSLPPFSGPGRAGTAITHSKVFRFPSPANEARPAIIPL